MYPAVGGGYMLGPSELHYEIRYAVYPRDFASGGGIGRLVKDFATSASGATGASVRSTLPASETPCTMSRKRDASVTAGSRDPSGKRGNTRMNSVVSGWRGAAW